MGASAENGDLDKRKSAEMGFGPKHRDPQKRRDTKTGASDEATSLVGPSFTRPSLWSKWLSASLHCDALAGHHRLRT